MPIGSSLKILTILLASFSISRPGSADMRRMFVVTGNGKLMRITLSLRDAI